MLHLAWFVAAELRHRNPGELLQRYCRKASNDWRQDSILTKVYCPGKSGKRIKRVGEYVVILLVVLRLMPHKLFRGDPMAVCRISFFQALRTEQESDVDVGVGVFVLVLFDDDDHRSVVIVAVAECLLAVLQFVEVIFAPVTAVDEVEAV